MAYKAALHNLGCKVNAYEVEAMQQALDAAGFLIVPFEPGADVYVINTCTVTNIADRKSRQMLHRAKKMDPQALVVAVGCYAQLHSDSLQQDPAIDLILGTNKKEELAQVVLEQLKARETQQENKIAKEPSDDPVGRTLPRTELSDLRRDRRYEPLEISRSEDHTRAILKIQDGCDNYCTYCVIPYARGPVRSRDPHSVLEEATRLLAAGTKEIVLTGIHLCSYGKDLGAEEGLLPLLRDLQKIEGLERLRLGSLEPSFLTPEVVQSLAALPSLCPHFHLSLQSGCDATLRRMGRRYTTEEYAEKVRLLRDAFDNPALTTDLITGFPGETEEEFARTRAFVEAMQFFETHVFPYSRREGTRAASMEGQCTEVCKKERSRVLLDLHLAQQEIFLRQFLQKDVEVLFEEEIFFQGERWISGHGRRYQQILCKAGDASPGEIRHVQPLVVTQGVLLA